MRTQYHLYREIARPLEIESRVIAEHYEITLADPGLAEPCPFTSREAIRKVKQAAALVRRHLETDEFNPAVWSHSSTKERGAAAVRKLACLGRKLLEALVPDGRLPDFVAALERAAGSRIELRGEMTKLPWEFVYLKPVQEGADIDKEAFLGRSVLLYRLVGAVSEKNSYAAEVLSYDADDMFGEVDPFMDMTIYGEEERVATGRIFDGELPSMKAPTRWQWHQVHKSSLKIENLKKLEFGTQRQKDDGRGTLITFMGRPYDLIHFDCHAEAATEFEDYRIKVHHAFMTCHEDLEAWNLRRSPDVLVVLNCCSSAVAGPYSQSAAGVLQANGGRSVVGTSMRTHDGFGMKFAKEFYDRMVTGTAVGDALFETRRHLFTTTGNPVALAYTLHGSPGHRLSAR